MKATARAIIAGATALTAIIPAASAQQAAPALADARPVGEMIAAAPRAMLRNGALSAEIALPDAAHGFYRGTRFDWSGMIIAVTLGKARFHGPWFDAVAPGVRDYVHDGARIVAGPQTGATGPAEEFQGTNTGPGPTPGYAEAAPGDTFVKIGVGRLQRTDARPYDRFSSYPIVDSGQWQVRRGADRITFVQTLPLAADGYGYRYEKSLRLLPDGSIVIAHRLANTGQKPISTQVYSHNFIRFGDHRVDPAITVTSPLLRGLATKDPALARVEGERLIFARPIAGEESVALSAPTSDHRAAHAAPVFTVARAGDGAIAAFTASPIARVVFWNIDRVNAVEPFVPIEVAPGGAQEWSWRYRYSAR
jgi:hypothetical protein